jgi:hypothetical protein
VAEMSCYSVAEEITSVCADYLVVDAVSRNSSPLVTGRKTGGGQGVLVARAPFLAGFRGDCG